MNFRISQKLIVAVCSVAVGAGAYAGLSRIQSLGFIAPGIYDRDNVDAPVRGEIVYDSKEDQFYGRKNSEWVKLSVDPTANPPGTVLTFAGVTVPDGYLPCDGHSYDKTDSEYTALFNAIQYTFGGSGNNFNVPNTQGVFIRGEGSQVIQSPQTLESVTYAGILGTVQSDQAQGHWHSLYAGSITGSGTTTPGTRGIFPNDLPTNLAHASTVRSPTTDGSNGAPRTGGETRPANITLKYIIKK